MVARSRRAPTHRPEIRVQSVPLARPRNPHSVAITCQRILSRQAPGDAYELTSFVTFLLTEESRYPRLARPRICEGALPCGTACRYQYELAVYVMPLSSRSVQSATSSTRNRGWPPQRKSTPAARCRNTTRWRDGANPPLSYSTKECREPTPASRRRRQGRDVSTTKSVS